MTARTNTVDFGAPEEFGAYIFRVTIPVSAAGNILVVEHYGFQSGERGIPLEETCVLLTRVVWSAIADTARKNFNDRLKAKHLSTGRWKAGDNKVDRLLGKELCVLAWAAEHGNKEDWPIICSKWAALRPEERWWLFAMTVAEAGQPEDRDRGWRKALYYALSDGNPDSPSRRRPRPFDETDHAALPLFRNTL